MNFGQEPYRFDLASFLEEESNRLFRISESIQLPPNTVQLIVRDYLMTHGYAQTLASLDLHQPPKQDDESIGMPIGESSLDGPIMLSLQRFYLW